MTERWKGLRITLVALAVPIALESQAAKFSGVLHAQHLPGASEALVGQDPSTQDRDRDRDDRRDRGDRNSVGEDSITLPSGSLIPVRLADEVSSSHGKAGELYTGTVDPSVLIHDHVVIPRGTEAHIRLVEVKKGGHFHGKAKVRLELVSLVMNGERLGVETDQPSKKEGAAHAKASAEAKRGAEGTGAGAMAGDPTALAGPVIAAFSAAKVDVKPGSRIEFTLEEPFRFRPPPVQSNEPNR
jgi:hypothetical protein